VEIKAGMVNIDGKDAEDASIPIGVRIGFIRLIHSDHDVRM